MTQPAADSAPDDSYPDAWRPPSLRRAEAEAQRRGEAGRREQGERAWGRATTAGGLSMDDIERIDRERHAYPSDWRKPLAPARSPLAGVADEPGDFAHLVTWLND